MPPSHPRLPRVVDARVMALGADALARLRALRVRGGLTDADAKKAADMLVGGLLGKLDLDAIVEEWRTFGQG